MFDKTFNFSTMLETQNQVSRNNILTRKGPQKGACTYQGDTKKVCVHLQKH